MEIKLKTYEELNKDELYEILQLRSQVFVVEQACVYQDLDGRDKNSIHIFTKMGSEIIAYIRIILSPDQVAIGRVLVKEGHRNKSHSRKLLQAGIDHIFSNYSYGQIGIEAQAYLEDFYRSLGFVRTSADFLLDGIPHLEMILKKSQ